MSKNAYILEAFKQFDSLTEDDDRITSEEMPIYDANSENMHDFLDVVGDDSDISIIDLEAEAEEDLKQSYVGKVILDCNVCHSNIFIDKDDIIVDEEGVANVDLECPYCMSNEGYTIIGQVEPYSEYSDDEEEIEIEDDEIEMTEDVDSFIKKVQSKVSNALNSKNSLLIKAPAGSGVVNAVKKTLTENGVDFKAISGKTFSAVPNASVVVITDIDAVPQEKMSKILNLAKKGVVIATAKDTSKLDRAVMNRFSVLQEGLITKQEFQDKMRGLYTDVYRGIVKDNQADAEQEYLENQLAEGCDKDKIDECGDMPVEESMKLDGVKKLKGIKKLHRRPEKDGVKAIRGRANSKISGTEDLRENIEDVSITTEDETMTMTTKEDGGVVIETVPKSAEAFDDDFDDFTVEETEFAEDEFAPEDEVIAPISDDEEEEIELNSEVDALEDDDIEALEEPEDEFDAVEFDEESFDELGESYLRKHYDNVEGFKTVNAKVFDSSIILEGVIRFTSGSSKGTSFVFEAAKKKNNSVLFEGYNSQISRGKKTFKLTCKLVEGCITPKKMSYNYMTKNELNESVRINGTCKVKR